MRGITTYSGEIFDPVCSDESKIQMQDIAHALSLLCRGNGHLVQFYSVAQHSINCAVEAQARGYSTKVQLGCLLHDASEAYLADITRPVKPHLSNYLELEHRLQSLIEGKFIPEPMSPQERAQVKQMDDLLLQYELQSLLRRPPAGEQPIMMGRVDLEWVSFASVEQRYLDLWAALTGETPEKTQCREPFQAVGIDGCKGKWLAVSIAQNGYEVAIFDTVDEACAYSEGADSVLIDMPIGLAEEIGQIRPDAVLRKQLKGKASSVFNTPCRQAVYQTEYTQASGTNDAIMGSKLSRQSFAIMPKIREIDLFLQENPAWKNRLLESHPEYCFSSLNRGVPVLENKQTADGATKRLALLSAYYPETYRLQRAFQAQYPSFASKVDDFLDALALALIGAIGLKNGFHTIPDVPSEDAKGIKMQIVGANIPKEAP